MSNLEIFEKSHFEDLFQLAFVVCLPRYLALSGWVVKGKLLQGRNTNRNPAQIPKEDKGEGGVDFSLVQCGSRP